MPECLEDNLHQRVVPLRQHPRTTFTPDDVAAKAARDGSLQLVTFYHDGSRVTGNPLAVMTELMGVAGGSQASMR